MPAISARLTRREVAVGGLSFAGVFALVTGAGAWNTRAVSDPAVTVLGAGDRLSMLVTDGPARLLIAAGSDTSAFGNAWAQALPPLIRRVDVLFYSTDDRDAAVTSKALRDTRPRYSFPLAHPDSDREQSVARWERAVSLSEKTVVSLTVSNVASGQSEPQPPMWTATIAHQQTRVVFLSEPSAASLASKEPISALVVSRGAPDKIAVSAAVIRPRAVVANAESANGRDLRQHLTKVVEEGIWTLGVHPGEIARLEFVAGGLRLPTSAIQIRASATPKADAAS